ncbi:ribonuclease III [Bifidobacterium xylocopae]|uniref:Ribonuclease 3 n=1 Tax=Bifidobacterium xylocopae TaxID=2493119 RepID=A0A366KD03_9BIFI|nr:ribonuclease III [Bifidobacterium xylocopae]RBP99247.1 ribonuclease III [Bifidobacterium xylocopae]
MTSSTQADGTSAAGHTKAETQDTADGRGPQGPRSQELPARELFKALGQTLKPDLLVHALTHRSFAHEHEGMPNNERLEFLGDAVLELVSTETLYRTHPDMNEGQLAKMRAKAVSEEALSAIARTKLHLGQYILLGHGEAESGGSDKDSILCDTVEALIGAVFIEHGIEGARTTVHMLVDDTLAEVATEGPALDWKTSISVKARKLGLGQPDYRMSVSGPDYAQVFTADLILEGTREAIGQGRASSKRKAQLAAAEKAWKALDDNGTVARLRDQQSAGRRSAQDRSRTGADEATTGDEEPQTAEGTA